MNYYCYFWMVLRKVKFKYIVLCLNASTKFYNARRACRHAALMGIYWSFTHTLHKKWSCPLRIFSVNVTKSAVSCEFGHIYWRNPYWKTSFFCAVVLRRYRGEYKHQQFMPIVSLHNPWKHQKIWKPEVLWCYQRI